MRFPSFFLAGVQTRLSRAWRAAPWWVCALALVCAGLAAVPTAHARPIASPVDALDRVPLSELPPEAQRMHGLIQQGGPFRFDKDGVVFGNRERILPTQPRGYYREYTVRTPGARGRGARRIVCGGEPRQPDACFYSDDHYASFRRIAP